MLGGVGSHEVGRGRAKPSPFRRNAPLGGAALAGGVAHKTQFCGEPRSGGNAPAEGRGIRLF